MRTALEPGKLQQVYNSVAAHYDLQHALLTARADQRGRRTLVDCAVRNGDCILDCGGGTGSTSLLAAIKAGTCGKVSLLDTSAGMLAVARSRIAQSGLQERIEIISGDMLALPFAANSFDVVLSTYSLCPLYDPLRGVQELYRVTRPGGRIGIAHSAEPEHRITKWLSDRVENVVWHFPAISLGCRAVSVMPALERMGCRLLFKKFIGVPLWPFLVFIMEKPGA